MSLYLHRFAWGTAAPPQTPARRDPGGCRPPVPLPLGAALPLPLVHWDLAEVPGGVVALVQAVSEL